MSAPAEVVSISQPKLCLCSKDPRMPVLACAAELQRSWIKQQTELVAVQSANQATDDTVHDGRAKLSILAQKQMRIESQFVAQEKQLRELDRGANVMHNEMGKINRLLADHAQKQQALADDNFLMESEFVERLKGLEQEVWVFVLAVLVMLAYVWLGKNGSGGLCLYMHLCCSRSLP